MVQHRGVGEGRSEGVASNRRTTVAEAAQVLGISAEAVRGRIRRGTLPVEREGGTVYVLIDRPSDTRTTGDQSRTTTDQPGDRTEILIAELQDRIRSLEDANRENRRIIAALTQRIPAIEAPESPEPRESPEMAADEQQGRGPVPEAGGPQEGTELPWWRRLFGG
jgi:hypothetical protein